MFLFLFFKQIIVGTKHSYISKDDPFSKIAQFIAKLAIPPNYRLHRRWWFNEGALYYIQMKQKILSGKIICQQLEVVPFHFQVKCYCPLAGGSIGILVQCSRKRTDMTGTTEEKRSFFLIKFFVSSVYSTVLPR
jgi:hypothetical protein